jgi:lysophospholipase L1-like esterase
MSEHTLQARLKTFNIRLALVFMMLAAVTGCADKAQLQALDTNATILSFGDSLTYGSGSSRDKTYPAILENLIKRRVINAGIPGEISATGLRRLPGLLKTYQPDLIIICHGANDILKKLDLKQTQNNIQQMIDMAKESQVQVVLIGVPGFNLFLSEAAMYQLLADTNQIPIDNKSLAKILKNNSLKSDYIHPNANGYQLLAKNINQLLITHGAFLDN